MRGDHHIFLRGIGADEQKPFLAAPRLATMAAVTIAGRLRQSAVAILRAAKSAPPRPPPDTASKVPEQGAGATAAAATSESSNSSWSSLLGYGKSSEPQPPTPGVPPLAGEGAADGVPAAVDAEALYAGLKVLGNLLASDLERTSPCLRRTLRRREENPMRAKLSTNHETQCTPLPRPITRIVSYRMQLTSAQVTSGHLVTPGHCLDN